MHELYIIAIIAIGVCALCFYTMGVEIGKLNTQIKVLRHELGMDRRDYKYLLEIEDSNDSKDI